MNKSTSNQINPIIAVDIDDVLARFAPSFCMFARERWGEDVTIHNFTEEWHKIFKINDPETIKNRAKEMFYDYDFYNQMEVITDANEVLLKLSKKFRLIPMTSRIANIREVTDAWLMRGFGNIFEEIIFSGAYELDKDYGQTVYLSKGELCHKTGVSYLIDDQPKHVIGAAEQGVSSLLFGDYSWNHDAAIASNVVRTRDWLEVAKYFGVD